MTVTILHGRREPGPSVSFVVLGKPEPAGSKRAFVNPQTGRAQVVDANKNALPWKQQVAGAAQVAVAGSDWELADPRPMRLELLFVIARPKGHFGTGRNAGTVRGSAPAFPVSKPDATKLLRAVEDALTGIVWRDDAQVVVQVVRKVFGGPERVEVVVSALGGPVIEQMELAA